MKVLFDHNVPKRLRSLLPGHEIKTSRELGWDVLKNGDLLNAAEANGFDAMVTGDKNMGYQQNLEGRRLALVILADTDWLTLKQNPAPIVAALDEATPGSFNCLRSLSCLAAPRAGRLSLSSCACCAFRLRLRLQQPPAGRRINGMTNAGAVSLAVNVLRSVDDPIS